MKQLALLLLIATQLAALPLSAQQGVDETAAPRPVVSVIAQQRGLPQPDFVGDVVARITVDLGFPMIGTVAERPVSLGDRVAKGDVLARLDPEDMTAALRGAEAGVSVAQANASSAADARTRAQTLVDRGVETQVTLDSAVRAQAAADAGLEQAQAQLTQAQDQLSLATLTAPRDGIVTELGADQGDTLSAGETVVQVSGLAEREIIIDLSEADAARLSENAVFAARLVADPSITARATLERIEPVTAQTTRTRRAHLALVDPPDAFRIGALARAQPVGDGQTAIALPEDVVVDGTVWVVTRTDAGATVRKTPVTVVATVLGYAVIAAGIDEGDEIVTRGVHSLEDGQTVGQRIPE